MKIWNLKLIKSWDKFIHPLKTKKIESIRFSMSKDKWHLFESKKITTTNIYAQKWEFTHQFNMSVCSILLHIVIYDRNGIGSIRNSSIHISIITSEFAFGTSISLTNLIWHMYVYNVCTYSNVVKHSPRYIIHINCYICNGIENFWN